MDSATTMKQEITSDAIKNGIIVTIIMLASACMFIAIMHKICSSLTPKNKEELYCISFIDNDIENQGRFEVKNTDSVIIPRLGSGGDSTCYVIDMDGEVKAVN